MSDLVLNLKYVLFCFMCLFVKKKKTVFISRLICLFPDLNVYLHKYGDLFLTSGNEKYWKNV